MQEVWEITTVAQHNSVFIRENTLVEQRRPSGSAVD